MLSRLAWLTTALTLCLVVLGAYVRLSDAGLACPDWPGCYGELVLPSDAVTLRDIQTRYPESAINPVKAHKEMAHRYLAAVVGLLVLALTILGFRTRYRWFSAGVLGLVILQALLGRWTVTELLEPLIVLAHLLGGLTILCLLCWLALAWSRHPTVPAPGLHPWLYAAAVVLCMQIALGGWTSANHAGLSCPDVPACRGQWWPPDADFKQAFLQPYTAPQDGGMIAIHLAHRLGAILTLLALSAAALLTLFTGPAAHRVWAWGLLALVYGQAGLGVANVLLRLPLPAAAAHNLLAALLVLTLTVLLYRTHRPA